MKRFLLIFAVLPALLVGCAKNGAENGGEEVTGGIVFSPGTYADDITQYDWVGGEQVHMFMVPAGKKINDAGAEAKIYEFVDGGGVVDDKLVGIDATNVMKFPEDKSVKFISYKPYTPAKDIVSNGYKFAVDTHVQSDYKVIDLLSADDGKVYSKLMGTTNVALSYRHMMSKVVVRMTSAVSANLTAVGAVGASGMPTHVEYNFITGLYENISQDNRAITGAPEVATDAVNTRVFEMIVVPQTTGWTNSQRNFTFNFNGIAHSVRINEANRYLPGMMYVYDIDIDSEISEEMVVKDPVVVDWGDGGALAFDQVIDELFTDPVFREYVSTKYSKGGPIFLKDVQNVTELRFSKNELIAPKTIVTLAGIEAFTELETLSIGVYNTEGLGIVNLDVSNNKALRFLYCNHNLLTSLDVSANKALTALECQGNPLGSFDVSANKALTILICSSNQLTSLDVSNNTALTYLSCNSNQLPSLDLRSNLALEQLHCENNLLTGLDVRSNTVLMTLRCSYNQLTNLNLSGLTALTDLRCGHNLLTSLDISNCVRLSSIAFFETNTQLTSINATNCASLINLIYNSGTLTSLNVSGATALTNLNCSGNRLTSLNVSGLTALKTLSCDSNQLTGLLDVSGLTALTTLYCYSNQLTGLLDVSGLTALTTLRCYSNQLNSLNVSGLTAVTNLQCYSNQLTGLLDVSGLTALTTLSCYSNQLTGLLDVSGLTALTTLYCYSNQLTGLLDVSGLTALTTLRCYSNQLTSLDVSGATALTELRCYSNQLTSLDVSGATALTELRCYSNRLTSLNVSGATALTSLYCYDNQLTSLDLSAHTILTKLTRIDFKQNPGNGTEAGVPPLADFEVKLPSGATPPSDWPQSGASFQWPYQFKDAGGNLIGSQFQVKTMYTNL